VENYIVDSTLASRYNHNTREQTTDRKEKIMTTNEIIDIELEETPIDTMTVRCYYCGESETECVCAGE